MKTQTQDELLHAHAQRDVANYSVGQHTPMSPNARQSAALDKITLMTLKARGKLLPGQPTAKQYAEQLKRKRAETIPDQYGEDKNQFIHNSTFKPITAYRYNSFKVQKQKQGIKLDTVQLKRQRSKARQMNSTMLNFKDNSVELYTKDDLARMAELNN